MMTVAVVLILAVAVPGWILGIRMCFGSKGTRLLKVHFCLVMGVVAALSYYLTYHVAYFDSSNTEVQGWPVPVVVFQRTGPGAPWHDYIGPTTILAYPLNMLLIGGSILGLSWAVKKLLWFLPREK